MAGTKNVSIEFVHNDYDTGTVTPFFGTITSTSLNGIDIADAKDASGETLSNKLGGINCADASCSLKISLNSETPMMIPLSFTMSTTIPDLNAIIVADGLSPNTIYHSRIIELIPLIQGI